MNTSYVQHERISDCERRGWIYVGNTQYIFDDYGCYYDYETDKATSVSYLSLVDDEGFCTLSLDEDGEVTDFECSFIDEEGNTSHKSIDYPEGLQIVFDDIAD